MEQLIITRGGNSSGYHSVSVEKDTYRLLKQTAEENNVKIGPLLTALVNFGLKNTTFVDDPNTEVE